MKDRYDVVVIGAGPAGSVAAYMGATRGLEVLLLDKATFPRFKVCGCCLNARALQTLDNLGLDGVSEELGAHSLTRLHVHVPGRRASFDLSGSVSVSRGRLDEALAARATRAGARFLDGTTATMGSVNGISRDVDLKLSNGTQRRVQAGVVVIADGLAGTALRDHRELDGRVASNSRMGAGTIVDHVPPGYETAVTLACARGGYVGTVRLEQGRLDVAAALDRDYVRSAGGPGRAVEQLLSETGQPPIRGLGSSAWRGTPALTRRRSSIAGERFFVVGDAAGYVEPFTGEGIAWAIAGAAAVSEWFHAASSRAWDEGVTRSWTRRYRALIRRRQWSCRVVAGILRRPRLARTLIGMCGRTPRLARPLVRHLTQPPAVDSGAIGR